MTVVDVHTPERRSFNMSRIGPKDSAPERQLRRELFARGYRFRLHRKDLPGSPDIVLPRHNTVIFVNGCFWHLHRCAMFRMPSTRAKYWRTKLTKNAQRDCAVAQDLLRAGWRVVTVWECALRGPRRTSPEAVADRIASWLPTSKRLLEIKS